MLQNPSQNNYPKERNKSILTGKGEFEWPLFVDSMILYVCIKLLKTLPEKRFQLIKEFIKVSEDKVNTENL